MTDDPFTKRFFGRVVTSEAYGPKGDCHRYEGYRGRKGYVQVKRGGEVLYAHRAAYEIHHGVRLLPPRLGGPLVCHRCDTPDCVKPAHLFLGTAKINFDDMVAKGRRIVGDQAGTANPGAKLTDKQVLAIRNDRRKLGDIAQDYGVATSCVSNIRNRKSWTHLA